MGKENSIQTGTISRSRNSGGLSVNTFNLQNILPSSIYQFGIVKSINTKTRAITYNIIEDNVVTNRTGTALPLYKNKIQLPNISYIVPLLRGPNTDVSSNGGQYSKTIYYLDPIGIWQTVDDNKIQKSTTQSPDSKDININNENITATNIGIPHNTPSNLQNKKNINQGKSIGKYLIIKPQINSNIFAVVIGAKPSSSYGVDFMRNQASQCGDLLKKQNFVFSDIENSIEDIKAELQKKYSGAIISSVTIFERAGDNVWGVSYKKNIKYKIETVKYPKDFFQQYKDML